MRFGDLIDWQHAINHRAQASGFDMAHDRVQFGEATHGGTENREQFEENETNVDRCFAAGGRSASHQSAATRQGHQRAFERLCADVLEHDVDAALSFKVAPATEKIRFAIKDRLVSAELLGASRRSEEHTS